jgi:hypothetical protein
LRKQETRKEITMKFKITRQRREDGVGIGSWKITHPDGYWVGPGLGHFFTIAAAMEWLEGQRK